MKGGNRLEPMPDACRVTEKVKIASLIYWDFFTYHIKPYALHDTDNENIQILCHTN